MLSKISFLSFLAGALLLSGCGGASTPIKDAPAPYGPVPSDAQISWHEMEMYCLIHFTPTTFQNKEWGYGDAPAHVFDPKHFDAGQIAAAAKAAGFTGLISVAKHHDGYCLWPTKTTDYNISKSPWKNGNGDMVKEFKEAAHAHGLQFGIYCSAWDRNHPEYGNEYYAEAYREQLRELYSNYGPLFISWHDGANGGDGYYGGADEMRRIDRQTYYGWEEKVWPITREMQTNAVIFSDVGPDTRWIGNENGIAPETSWATFTPVGPDGGRAAPGHVDDRFLGSGQRDGDFWIPAECDVPLRPGWFYHPEQDHQVKTPDQLFEIYLKSVGRGAAFNLGLAPMPDGVLHPTDVAVLEAFGKKVKETFVQNLARGASFVATNVRGGDALHFGPANLVDEDRYSYWATEDDVITPELIVELNKETTFDIIRLRENIKLGQRLDSVWIDKWDGSAWQPLASATSIGANRLIKLDNPTIAKRLRLRLFAPVATTLSDFGLFREADSEYRPKGNVRKGVDRANWRVTVVGAPASALSAAVDGDPQTLWLGRSALPLPITIDMGRQQRISGFSYLPRQDRNTSGIISRYLLESSEDGVSWQRIGEGEFSNIVANPIAQYIGFREAISLRYLRFTALAVVNAADNQADVGIAELNAYE